MHELGHVFYHHMTKTVALELVIAISSSALFVLFYQDIVFQSFGFHDSRPVIAGIFIRMDLLLGKIIIFNTSGNTQGVFFFSPSSSFFTDVFALVRSYPLVYLNHV